MMEAEIIHVWNERHHFYGSYLYDSSQPPFIFIHKCIKITHMVWETPGARNVMHYCC